MYSIKGVQPGAYRAEIAAEIAKSLGSDDFWQRYAAAQAIRPWATEREAPAILEAVKRGGEGEYYDWVLIAAGKFPSTEAAEAVAAQLPAHRDAATAALIEMGPVAEDAAIKLSESKDHNVRAHAAVILGVIGTEKSLPALSHLKSDSFAHAKECAEKSWRYIQARKGGA
jgi:HEAT repeat protein